MAQKQISKVARIDQKEKKILKFEGRKNQKKKPKNVKLRSEIKPTTRQPFIIFLVVYLILNESGYCSER